MLSTQVTHSCLSRKNVKACTWIHSSGSNTHIILQAKKKTVITDEIQPIDAFHQTKKVYIKFIKWLTNLTWDTDGSCQKKMSLSVVFCQLSVCQCDLMKVHTAQWHHLSVIVCSRYQSLWLWQRNNQPSTLPVLCEGNHPVTDWFHTQMVSNTESMFMAWHLMAYISRRSRKFWCIFWSQRSDAIHPNISDAARVYQYRLMRGWDCLSREVPRQVIKCTAESFI